MEFDRFTIRCYQAQMGLGEFYAYTLSIRYVVICQTDNPFLLKCLSDIHIYGLR